MSRTYQLVLVSMFAALMAIGANITAFLVIGGVPITMQAFFSILAGALLGRRLGALSIIVYIFIGLIGFPVFAQFKGGLSHFVNPTFGFLLSFVLVAYITGWIVEKSREKTLKTFLFASFSGLITTYVIGTNYMYFAYQFLANLESIPYAVVVSWMIAPFIKDFIFTIIASVLAKRMYAIVNKNRNENETLAA